MSNNKDDGVGCVIMLLVLWLLVIIVIVGIRFENTQDQLDAIDARVATLESDE